MDPNAKYDKLQVSGSLRVDEPAENQFMWSRFRNLEEDIEYASRKLERLLDRCDTEADIQCFLDILWAIVHRTLSQDLELVGSLADIDEFQNYVKRKSEKEFVGLLRDTAKRKSMRYLLKNEAFFKPVPEDSEQCISVDATVRAWNSTYKGGAAELLLLVISSYLDRRRPVYTRCTILINSSGTGKSRMVDQVAKTVVTVPMCLREVGRQGFPPSDRALRGWFHQTVLDSSDQALEKLETLICSLLAVLQRRLEAIASDIPELPTITDISKLSSPEWDKYASLIRQRHEMLAFSFRDLMTREQSFERPNPYRQTFYEEVIDLATKFTTGNEDIPGEKLPGFPKYSYKHRGLIETGERLCRFLDPNGLFDLDLGLRRPFVILAFDEYHTLCRGWAAFSPLIHVLQKISPFPIFSLIISTPGRIHPPAPRRVSDLPPPLEPITEISFDDLAFPARKNTVSLDRGVQTDWISHLGRPLFGAYHDTLIGDDSEKELLVLARQKLLNGKSRLVDEDDPGSFACLSVRFSLELKSSALALTQVEGHMRLCMAATTRFETLITHAGSEPLIAEAASQVMRETLANPVCHLANHPDLDRINRGSRGELVASLIIMQARDAASAIRGRRWVSVCDFMQALLPPPVYETLERSLPTFWREGEDKPFGETFGDYAMWFNHIIRIENDERINAKSLWKFITRGAMIGCPQDQDGIDIVLPVCLTKGNLSRDTVTAILIQVRNVDRFRCNISQFLFDEMDPFELGVFSDDQVPRPVIRIVLALGSDVAGVVFPTVREQVTPDAFTAFDIWCAGLSPDTYKCVGDDLASYRLLLEHSQFGRLPASSWARTVMGW